MERIDLNRLAKTVVESSTNSTRSPVPVNNGVIALALIFLGECIREGTANIGPAIENAVGALATETGGIATALNNVGAEIAAKS